MPDREAELYSESQSDRTVLTFRNGEGELATVIVLRKRRRVWLVFHGTEKTTLVMNDPEVPRLVEALTAPSRGPNV